MYIHEMPYTERDELCKLLDYKNTYKELGIKYMQYDRMTIYSLSREADRGKSPTDELLTLWSQQNHTVKELFILLSRMKHYQAMTVIKRLVDGKYHDLIQETDQNLTTSDNQEEEKELNVAPQQQQPVEPQHAVLPQQQQFPPQMQVIPQQQQLQLHLEQRPQQQHLQLHLEQHELLLQQRQLLFLQQKLFHQHPQIRLQQPTQLLPQEPTQPLPQQQLQQPRYLLQQQLPQLLEQPQLPRLLPQHLQQLQLLPQQLQQLQLHPPQQQQPQPSTPKSPQLLARQSGNSNFSNLSQGAESSIPQIPYDDLKQSTNHWDKEVILGKGGFGIVFKGTWKNTEVAIKRIEHKEKNAQAYNEQMKQSITELHCLNSYRHDNVLSLYGYSIDGPQPCLIYQYMRGGSLDYRLHTKDVNKHLNWTIRFHIAIGTARGLQFLHTIGGKPLIHGDIKPANILLDLNDNPRIGDFGLAREGPNSNYSYIKISRVHGTRPYLPMEFLRGRKFSTKVDTYSFGIVLFEMATGLYAYSDQRERDEKYLKDLIVNFDKTEIMKLKDRRAGPNGDDYFRGLMEIGTLCVSELSRNRPEMVNVLSRLETVVPAKQ